MSFIQNKPLKPSYQPGWFLVEDENCLRLTKEVSASSALVVTDAYGAKHVPMGTAYPTNDSYAVGILYEDVDVTTGDMPGSVVMSGVVYEDRLAVTSYAYDSITLKNLVSPKAQGWQERSGSGTDLSPYTYADSTDTTVNTSKTYYEDDDDHTEVSDYAAVLNPKAEGWYESDGAGGYEPSTDTEGDKTKTYYEQSPVKLSANAKSALASAGFTFVSSAPAVTRPY